MSERAAGGSAMALPQPGELESAALAEEIAKLELRITRAWQLTGVLGLGGALVVGLTTSTTLGIWGALATLGYLGWFSLHAALLPRAPGSKALRLAAVLVESTLPWAFLLVLMEVQGAAYALGSWVPPLLYAAVMIAAMTRLQPVAALVIGIASGGVLLILYFLVLRHRLPPEAAALPLYQPTMQISRAISFALGGVVSMLVAKGLRRAFERAQRTVRSQDLFGKYRIGRRIAAGGMGTVYEANYCPEGGFARPVAVKRIHTHLAQAPEFVRSFRGEAELSARLVHPNIVQVLDFGRVEDSYFLAMEYVDGLTLRALMRRACSAELAVASTIVLHIAREILAGLDHAHARARDANGQLLRVVHRDLSPSNILLSRHGEVKVGDFGVAKVLRDAAVSETRTVAGHLAYMAPEQAAAQPIDERCDLFAVGVIVWELLCGRPLFLREGEAPTLLALMSEPVAPPSSLREGLDLGWDAIVARALEREASQRYDAALSMSAELARLPEARDAGGADALAALVAQLLAMRKPSRPAALEDDSDELHASDELPTRVAGRHA